MGRYSTDVKQRALEKVLRPGAQLMAISREMDIPKDTLYFWMRKAQNGLMGAKSRKKLQDKLGMVLEARGLRDEDLGKWLREKGLHAGQIDAWEKEIDAALGYADGREGREAALAQENKELQREVRRKDRALAEMSALVVLKKKLASLLGEEEQRI